MARSSLKNIVKLISNYSGEEAIEQSFLYDLKRSIEITDEKNRTKSSQTYKPSSMNCIRASYYQIIGADSDESPSAYTLVGICNSGTDIHIRTQRAVESMKENGINCEYINVADFVKQRGLDYLDIKGQFGEETKLYDKYRNISFLCDGIIKYKSKYYIIEFKTENSFKWGHRSGVDLNHYNQAITYSLELGLDDVIFIYISRDNLDMKSYLFHVTDDMRNKILDYIKECDSYLALKIVPPKEPLSLKSCTYCTYKGICEKDGD